ncbi:hypothetical protein LTR86_000184 [Recurvomyces mirabilis]|nr:hypothetical protein LTR86_000184 [Recurvomyces mirabilis]
MSNYTQGHSACTTATHQRRTAETDAAFLLPHIRPTDKILDVGCGPGTITAGFVKYVPQGGIVGVDISTAVLQKAKGVATEAGTPAYGPGSLDFGEGNILKGLPYEDNTFDIVFSSQVIGHMVPPDQPLTAIAEMRRVVKSGGIVACRDAAFQHFYPAHLDLDRLWVGNMNKVIYKGVSPSEAPGKNMLPLFRKAGFDVDGGKVVLGAGAMVHSGPDERKWLAWRAAGQLKEGDAFRQSWLDAGVSKEEIEETLEAIGKWRETEDAWFVALQCEMLGWK